MACAPEKIVYIYGEKLISECNRLPPMLNRASIVQDLINSYQLLLDDKFLVVQSENASEDELKSFHSSAYIEFLQKCNDVNINELDKYEDEMQEYGLNYDCPLLERNYELVSTIAGGSVSAAKLLTGYKCRIAINWFGGWHHAQRDAAEGFCYVNDIVIASQMLNRSFGKVLYIDLDIHHGNAVQNAFEYSNKILCMSFHRKSVGFFPGTGDLSDVGTGKGTYYSLNIPLREGISHNSYVKLFTDIFNDVYSSFQPQAIVVQCGADGLNGDSIGQSNLTLKTYEECIRLVLNCDLPTLFLGGGGYNFPNTARLWAFLTSVIAGINLDEDIPDICEYFPKYGPSYELHIDPSLQKDRNSEDYLEFVINQIKGYCKFIQ